MDKRYGILVDVEYCTGCNTCQTACQQEHNYTGDKCGLKVMCLGPYNIAGDKWQYDYFPAPLEWCNMCLNRVKNGKKPSCVQHCQAQCIEIDELATLLPKVTKPKQALFVIR